MICRRLGLDRPRWPRPADQEVTGFANQKELIAYAEGNGLAYEYEYTPAFAKQRLLSPDQCENRRRAHVARVNGAMLLAKVDLQAEMRPSHGGKTLARAKAHSRVCSNARPRSGMRCSMRRPRPGPDSPDRHVPKRPGVARMCSGSLVIRYDKVGFKTMRRS